MHQVALRVAAQAGAWKEGKEKAGWPYFESWQASQWGQRITFEEFAAQVRQYATGRYYVRRGGKKGL